MITVKIRKSKFSPDDYSAYLSFPYNQDVIDTIKELRYRSWIKGSKEWEIRIQDLPVLFQKFHNHDFDISGRYEQREENILNCIFFPIFSNGAKSSLTPITIPYF